MGCGASKQHKTKRQSDKKVYDDVIENYTKMFREAILRAMMNHVDTARVEMAYSKFHPIVYPTEFAKALEQLTAHDYEYIFANDQYTIEITWSADLPKKQIEFIGSRIDGINGIN